MGRVKRDGEWRGVHVGVEGDEVCIGGLFVWRHDWRRTGDPAVFLPHPAYPHQTHRFNVYEIGDVTAPVRFAAGELSTGVWGFYVPASSESGDVALERISRFHPEGWEYARFLRWLEQHLASGALVEVSQQQPYSQHYPYLRFFRHVATGQIWQLAGPDGPMSGHFIPVDRPPNFDADISTRLSAGHSKRPRPRGVIWVFVLGFTALVAAAAAYGWSRY